MGVPYRVSPYEPVRVYDAPEMLLSNLFEGELTPRGVSNTLFNTSGLSPAERDTLRTRLKSADTGGPMGALANTVVDLALNPLVWLAFAFQPAAATALGRNQRVFTQEARSRPIFGMLDHGAQHANGTTMIPGIEGAKGPMAYMRSVYRTIVENPEAELIREWGGDPRKTTLRDMAAKHPELRRKYMAMGLIAGNLHKNVTASSPVAVPRMHGRTAPGQMKEIFDPHILLELEEKAQHQRQFGETGDLKVHWDEGTQTFNTMGVGQEVSVVQGSRQKGELRIIDPGVTRKALISDAKYGISKNISAAEQKVIDGWSNYHDATNLHLLGREELAHSYLESVGKAQGGRVHLRTWLNERKLTPQDALDVEKLKAHWQVHEDTRAGRSTLFKKDAVGWGGLWESLFHPTVRQALEEGHFDAKDWDRLVRQGFEGALDSGPTMTSWQPYGMSKSGKGHVPLDPDTWMAQASKVYGKMVGRVPRRGLQMYSQKGLQNLAELFPEAIDDLVPHLTRSDARLMDKALTREPAWLSELDPGRAMFQLQNDAALEYGAVAYQGASKDKMLEVAQREVAARRDKSDLLHDNADYHVFADEEAPAGGWTYRHAIENGLRQVPEAESRRFLEETVIPAAFNKLPQRHAVVELAIGGLQGLVRKMHGTKWAQDHLGKTEVGQKILMSMRQYGEGDRIKMASSLVNGTAKYIYSATLGFPNMAPLVLQMTQRALHESAFLGGMASNEAYFGYALPKMYELIKARAKLPARLSTMERDSLFKSVLGDDAPLLGFHGHEMEALDQLAFREGGEMSWKEFLLIHAPLMPFQATEITNRLSTIGAVRARHLKAGISPQALADVNSYEHARLKMDVNEAQREFNLSTDALSTPKLFMEGPVMNSQLARQFLSFTVRAPVSAVNTMRRVAGGKRSDTLGISDEWPAFVADSLRFAGISAIVYETGKNLLGADLSPGLAASSMSFGLDGADRQNAMEGGLHTLPMPAPPILQLGINIPWGIINALGGDTALLRDNIARVLPGGIGLQKILGGAPNLQSSAFTAPLGLMQKKYVDWRNPTPDGRVGQFSWDGRLIDYQKPSALVLAGLGVDLGAHKEAGDIDGWLVKQRDEIVQLRHQALMALAANDVPKVQSVQREFQKRFQIPLTISKQQFRAFMKQRNVPRTERILDSFPSDVRPQILEVLKGQYSRLGMQDETAMAAETSAKRGLLSPRLSPTSGLESTTLEALNQMVAERANKKPINERTFQ